jgi:hypothetical protein
MGFRLNGHDGMHIDDQSATKTRPIFRKLGKQSTDDECLVGQIVVVKTLFARCE